MPLRLLDHDPDLGRRLDPRQFELAKRALIAPSIDVPSGPWTPDRSEPEPGHLGLLIVHGFMIREVLVAGARSIELLNSGDLLKPWLEDSVSFVEARWRAIEPTRMAVLEPKTAARAAHWPALVEAITDRGMRRSRSLAVWAAIEAIRGIDKRLWVLFWHLAEHWGDVEPDGSIVVPLNLTHETLSILVGARRPSVSTALSRLASAGQLKRAPGRGWRLRGEPPAPRE